MHTYIWEEQGVGNHFIPKISDYKKGCCSSVSTLGCRVHSLGSSSCTGQAQDEC